MQLVFEVVDNVGVGNYPDVVHFANTQAQLFYLDGGELYGAPTRMIDEGIWSDAEFREGVKVSPDVGMSNFELKVIPGWGMVGGYKTADKHKLIIYEFAFEMDIYLNDGSIKHSIDDPVSSFTLQLENPDTKNPEHPGNVAINEENSLLSPGAKVNFKFKMGDSDDYDMGIFYVDRSNFVLKSETASVDGRNLIGKALKDQTLDENYRTGFKYIHEIIENMFLDSYLNADQYLIETSSKKHRFNFDRKTDILTALEEIFKIATDWKISELVDGTLVVGSPTYAGFPLNHTYTFYRNKDIFSREITRDDMGAYRRVCVHTSDYSIEIYKEVQAFTGWNSQSNKTLYVQVPDGTRNSEATSYADEIASRLSNVGKIESFTGPFRPHLLCGDEAVIVNDAGMKTLGLITEITHNFGKSGYYTRFTVDSGGRLGKGRLSEYINRITRDKKTGSIEYEDIV